MFKQHTSIFVTFDPADGIKARNFIRSLVRKFPSRQFFGRHQSLTDHDAVIAITKTTLTLILETKNTAASLTVQHDIQASFKKTPPNEILRIVLDGEEQMPDNCAIQEMLAGSGAEHIGATLSDVAEAFCRLDLLTRYEPKIRDAVGRNPSAAIPCSRN